MIKERHTSLNSTAAGCSVRHTRSNTLGIESSSNLRGKKPFLSFTEHPSTHVSFPTCLSSPTRFPAHLQLKQAAKEFLLPTAQLHKSRVSCYLTWTLKVIIVSIRPDAFKAPQGDRRIQNIPNRAASCTQTVYVRAGGPRLWVC